MEYFNNQYLYTRTCLILKLRNKIKYKSDLVKIYMYILSVYENIVHFRNKNVFFVITLRRNTCNIKHLLEDVLLKIFYGSDSLAQGKETLVY